MVMVGIEDIREVSKSSPVLIKVIGAGGGGGNAVNNMVSAGVQSVDFIVANTDAQDLKSSLAPYKLQLGSRATRGMGAGARPEVGRESALEDVESIREYLTGSDMVFITAGLGGGTGTGAAPVIAEVAREIGCLTVGVVTKPFKFEGKQRARNADEGILQLRKHVDTLIVIPNDNLLLLANKKTSIVEAFAMADDVLRMAIQGISDLINTEGLINLDFADVKTVMANMGQAIMGTGIGTGDNRAIDAAEKAIRSPLLDDCSIDGAKGILINVSGPESLTLMEVNEAASYIEQHADGDAVIIFGAAIDEKMAEDTVEVTVIATGFGMEATQEMPPAEEAAPRRRASYNVFTDAGRAGAEPSDDSQGVLAAAASVTAEETAASAAQVEAVDDTADSEVFELQNAVLEPVETTPQVPQSYRPEEARGMRGNNVETDLDIPTFIRKRSMRIPEE